MIFRSCDSKNHRTIFFKNLNVRFCPYNPPYKPEEKKTAPPLCLEEDNIFQKADRNIAPENAIKVKTREPSGE
jgi:hypothetical protein